MTDPTRPSTPPLRPQGDPPPPGPPERKRLVQRFKDADTTIQVALISALALLVAAIVSGSFAITAALINAPESSEADNKITPTATPPEQAVQPYTKPSTPVASATPTPSAPATPSASASAGGSEPGYVVDYTDRKFTLTASAGGCKSSVADLDQPAVESGEVSMEGQDMAYGCGDGLTAEGYFGTTSASLPSPENCASDAKANSVGEVSDTDLERGQAFCLITDEDAVVWMKLVKKAPGGINGEDLTFQATLWKLARI